MELDFNFIMEEEFTSFSKSLKREGIQLAEPFEERRILNKGRFRTTWSIPYLVQPKLNGERCRIIVPEKGTAILLSSTALIVHGVPHIQEEAANKLPVGEYDGELYKHGMSWADIHAIVSRKKELHPNYKEMEIHLFDLIAEAPQWVRLMHLKDRLIKASKVGKLESIKEVDTSKAYTLEELYLKYEEYLSARYEGFIVREMYSSYVRKRTGAMMKFKPKQLDHYKIIDIGEEISAEGVGNDTLGKFQCIDNEGTIFFVSPGKLTHLQRKDIWESYKTSPESVVGKILEIEYQTLSDKNKVPLFSRSIRILPADYITNYNLQIGE